MYRGVAQLVARTVWDREVACSSQVAPTTQNIKPVFDCFAPVKLRSGP